MPFLSKLNRIYWDLKPFISLRKISQKLNDINIKKPIFILGTQGGGLTIISRILHRHPDTVYCSGNSKFWASSDEMHQRAFYKLPKVLRLSPPRGSNGVSDFYNEDLGFFRSFCYASNSLFKNYKLDEDDYIEEDAIIFKNLIREYIRAYSINKTSSARFVDKSQSYTLKIPWLLKCFPDAKLILVTRNPYALCKGRSLDIHLKKLYTSNKKHTSEDLLRINCEHWKNTYDKALKDLKGRHYLSFKFEDFLEEPLKFLNPLLNYCELENYEDLLPNKNQKFPAGSISQEKWFPLQKDPNKKYLDQLSKKEKIIISNIVDNVASKFQYFPPDI